MSFDANKIADTIVALSRERGGDITNLKLQKLLYYAQAWHLAFSAKPLFLDAIEAWVHGPVVPSVFRRFREYRWRPIDCAFEPCDDNSVVKHIASVLNAYGKFDASQLERLTHSEEPWINARRGLAPDISSCNVISHHAMRQYYAQRLNADRRVVNV